MVRACSHSDNIVQAGWDSLVPVGQSRRYHSAVISKRSCIPITARNRDAVCQIRRNVQAGSVTVVTPADERTVFLQRKAVSLPSGNGNNIAQPGRHSTLATAVAAPSHHSAVALDCQGVIESGGDVREDCSRWHTRKHLISPTDYATLRCRWRHEKEH